MSLPAGLPEVISQIIPLLPTDRSAWLVGGSVRDLLLGRPTVDFDFVIDGETIEVAKHIADHFSGSYYDLDRERGIGRVLLKSDGEEHLRLDFGGLRGLTIEADLRARDFTINALAINLHHPEERLDPTGGARDLKEKVLRACSPSAIDDDPIRALRAARLAVDLSLRIEPDTLQQVKTAGPGINEASPERLRDELMRMLDIRKPGSSLRLLDYLNLLEFIFPDLSEYWKRDPKTFELTMTVMDRLTDLLRVLGPEAKPEAAAEFLLAEISLRLGRFRIDLTNHLYHRISYGRKVRQLLFFAALYHEVGKPSVHPQEKDQPVKPNNDAAIKAETRAKILHLSNPEVARIGKIVRYSQHLPTAPDPRRSVSPLAIHRFYRKAGPAGVEATLIGLAEFLAIRTPSVPQEAWRMQVELARNLLEAYFEARERLIEPAALVNGNDLMVELDLNSGPLIGQLLEKLLEAQVEGKVKTRQEALAYAKENLQAENRSSSEGSI